MIGYSGTTNQVLASVFRVPDAHRMDVRFTPHIQDLVRIMEVRASACVPLPTRCHVENGDLRLRNSPPIDRPRDDRVHCSRRGIPRDFRWYFCCVQHTTEHTEHPTHCFQSQTRQRFLYIGSGGVQSHDRKKKQTGHVTNRIDNDLCETLDAVVCTVP